MKLREEQIRVPAPDATNPLDHFSTAIASAVGDNEYVVRAAVTRSTSSEWNIELGVVVPEEYELRSRWKGIFSFRKRVYEDTNEFNVALVLPTGIGAELGGHAGDAGPTAALLGKAADCVVTHPNVVNASDINELPENGLYVEGSILARLLMGEVGLSKSRSNRVLTIIDDHPERPLVDHAVNAVGGARAAMGLDSNKVVRLSQPLQMKSIYAESGRAAGDITGLEHVLEIAEFYRSEYDALAVTSRIQVPKSFHHEYYLGGLVNPWGGVEAMLTHTLSTILGVPTAHAPMMESEEILNLNLGVVDPRMAAEVVSVTYLNSILKGLQRSPRVIWDQALLPGPGILSAESISAVVVPAGSLGLPTLAALEQGIPVIEVMENSNLMENDLSELGFRNGQLIRVRSYLEAAGALSALRSGVSVESLQRPLRQTRVEPGLVEERAKEFGDVVRLRSQ